MQAEFLHRISFLYKIEEEKSSRKIIKQIGFKFCSFAKSR